MHLLVERTRDRNSIRKGCTEKFTKYELIEQICKIQYETPVDECREAVGSFKKEAVGCL